VVTDDGHSDDKRAPEPSGGKESREDGEGDCGTGQVRQSETRRRRQVGASRELKEFAHGRHEHGRPDDDQPEKPTSQTQEQQVRCGCARRACPVSRRARAGVCTGAATPASGQPPSSAKADDKAVREAHAVGRSGLRGKASSQWQRGSRQQASGRRFDGAFNGATVLPEGYGTSLTRTQVAELWYLNFAHELHSLR
jgi:hypothetical protein